jgi:PAS domain S-box-containing protein
MSWVTVIWSMTASACLTLAAIQFLVWCHRREVWADLLFTLTSTGVAFYAGCELWMVRAETPEQFATALRWLQVPTWVVVVSLAGFVRFHFRAGRPWLGWSVFALRSLALLLNFLVGQNLNYREVTRLRHVPFLGESASLGVGVSNPCMIVGQLSLLLLVIFTVDATITVWRRGDRRQALVTGGSIVVFTLTGMAQAVLVLWRMVDLPLTESFFFLGIVVAMGYDMSRATLRAAQLSEDLRESEARMTLAAEAAGFGIWMWTLATNRVWGSERWLRLFGFASDEAVGFEKVIQRVHPDDREMVEREMRRALADQSNYAGEYRVVLPDSTRRWIVARGRVYPGASTRPARMMGTAVDITARKQSELEIGQQRNELAHLSRVNMLGELAGSLAHELNQPLTAILSNAQAAQRFLAHDQADLNEVRNILTDIVSEDKRAGEVIHRLRLLLKKGEIQNLPLDVNEVVQEVLKLVRSDLVNQGFSAQTELAPDLPVVHGDRVQLQQVLINLVLNACDAMAGGPAGRRKLHIRTALAEGEGVCVSVADRGIGLAPDKLETIFEPFFTTKAHGMGLGLSVCRSIITAHGGKLWATNNPERGATFHFTLPVSGERHESVSGNR